MRKPRILLTGGGTGGHVFPLVAVARELQKTESEVFFVGPEEYPLDSLAEEEVKIKKIIRAGKLRRYFSLKTIWEFFKIPLALFQSWFFIRKWRPDIVLGKGGYGSIAPVLVAQLLNIPIVLHESDVVPGLANKFLARFADQVCISFEKTRKYLPNSNTLLTGNPVRLRPLSEKKMALNKARRIIDLNTRKKTILIIGGSQGAVSLNKLVDKSSEKLSKNYALIISTGKDKTDILRGIKNNKNVVVKEFLSEEELVAGYTLADLVVSRAGAGSIFETALYARPSILIPLKNSAGNHQWENAKAYEESGATIVLEEEDINEQVFVFSIDSIIKNKKNQIYMSRQAESFAKPKAAQKIADILINKATNKLWGRAIH